MILTPLAYLPTYLPCTSANEFVISSVNFITNCVLDFTVCCEYKPHESSPSSHHHHNNNNRTISCCFFAAEGDGKRSLKWRIRLKTIDKILSNLKQQKKRFCFSLSLSNRHPFVFAQIWTFSTYRIPSSLLCTSRGVCRKTFCRKLRVRNSQKNCWSLGSTESWKLCYLFGRNSWLIWAKLPLLW